MKPMRWLVAVLVCALGLTGCAKLGLKKKQAASSQPAVAQTPPKTDKTLIVTPVTGIVGKIASVRPELAFVVITLERGQTVAPEQKLNVYRTGLKVGEVKVSREQLGQNVVADLVAGEAKVGDEVRVE